MKKTILGSIGGLVLILSFQNCSPGFEVGATSEFATDLASSAYIGKGVASWSEAMIWRRDTYAETYVHMGRMSYETCATSVVEGAPCSSNSSQCQFGSGKSAEVYRCGNTGYDVSGYVVDLENQAPLAGVLVEFHTGSTVNVFQGYEIRTNSNGYYSASLPAQPGLILASLEGYEDGRNPGLPRAKVTIVNNKVDALVLRRVSTGSVTSGSTNKASCSFNGNIILHSHSVTAFQASSAPQGSSCVSELRLCNNGILSGSYAHSNCLKTVSTTPQHSAPAQSGSSGWGADRKWSRNSFEDSYVNSSKLTHPQCANTVAQNAACSSEGAYCQFGSAPSASVFHCSSSFKASVTVVDVETKAPIAGASLEISTGYPGFSVGGPTAGSTDANGNFTGLYNSRPGLVKASKLGYVSPTTASQNYGGSSFTDSGSAIVYLKKASSTAVGQSCVYLYRGPVVDAHASFAAGHCGAPHWDGAVQCEYSSGRYTKGEGWGKCQCFKYVASSYNTNGQCNPVDYQPTL